PVRGRLAGGLPSKRAAQILDALHSDAQPRRGFLKTPLLGVARRSSCAFCRSCPG
ncbi:unnamed protein product, partial [Amoebophrya sp. A120]